MRKMAWLGRSWLRAASVHRRPSMQASNIRGAMTLGPRAAPCVLAIIVASCGGSPTTSSSPASSLTLHAEVIDPLGDSVLATGIPTAPDLVRGAVDVTNGTVTFTIQFAPGTMSAQTTRL